MKPTTVFALFGITGMLALPPLKADTLVAQAKKPTPREILAGQIKNSAYKFAENPSDYSLVTNTEQLNWKMIKMSEGLSSCALPAYDLGVRIEAFNATFVMMQNLINSFPSNTPKSIVAQSTASVESTLNGQKAAINKVLEAVIANCH